MQAVRSERLFIKTFGTEEDQIQVVVQIFLEGIESDLNFNLTAYALTVICAPLKNQAIEVGYQSYPYLKGLKFDNDPGYTPDLEMDILVESDSCWNLVTGAVKRGGEGPLALNTRLGWVLPGPVDQSSDVRVSTTNYISSHTLRMDTSHTRVDKQLEKFWELESIGIKQNSDRVHDKFLQELTFNNRRYEGKLP